MEGEITQLGLTLIFDFVKYITTLDTGLILILATLLEKVFTRKIVWEKMMTMCILSIAVSIVGSLLFLGSFSTWLIYRGDWPEILITIGFYVSIGGFFLALLCFVLFTYKNFSQRLEQNHREDSFEGENEDKKS